MSQLSLALLWHQHQPYYPDDVAGENPMPWVRLHASKDYWGMAALLKEVPEVHCTINLVPSLLVQLLGYTEAGHEDEHLRVSRLPADSLTADDMNYLLDNFFMVHPDQMIRPFPRYWELYQKRGLGVDSASRAVRRFNRRDVLDLQCWSNLTWMHPLAFEQDADLAGLMKKGRQFTEDDKRTILDKQMALLREVVPLHRELSERGQVELTTTPFYHPILPLLWDKRLARQAMPDVNLPQRLESYREDAVAHIRRGVEYHQRLFGAAPKGMWPSEGSVCQEIVPALAEAGVGWIATDEEILSCSTNGWVSRDGGGFLRNPEMLYRPWRVEEAGKSVQMVFRDHAMSDLMGFHYQRFEAQAAVNDFVGKLEGIRHATSGKMGSRPPLASVILDGENCWEYYPNSGVNFLRSLYRRLAADPHVAPVTVGEYIERYPASDRLGRLFAGSWISHNFGIWIGHPECNRAWDALSYTRDWLRRVTSEGKKAPERIRQAWEELYIAEGSDWFWWYGDDHNSAQDGLFDRLFRKHLQNVYTVLDEEPPLELAQPIASVGHAAVANTQPTGLLDVKVDGRRTYFEWINAGHHACSTARGTMSMGGDGLLSDVYFGFDGRRLLLRLDTRGGPANERLVEVGTLRVAFLQPEGIEILVAHPEWSEPIAQLYREDVPVAVSGLEVACETIFELSVPCDALAVEADDPVRFSVELLQNDQPVERAPNEGVIDTHCPSPDYELMMWQV